MADGTCPSDDRQEIRTYRQKLLFSTMRLLNSACTPINLSESSSLRQIGSGYRLIFALELRVDSLEIASEIHFKKSSNRQNSSSLNSHRKGAYEVCVLG